VSRRRRRTVGLDKSERAKMTVERLALLVTLLAVAAAGTMFEEEEEPDIGVELERLRRIPYYFPASFQRNVYWGAGGGGFRKRAMSPARMDGGEDDDDEEEEELDGRDSMDRRRRILYHYPLSWEWDGSSNNAAEEEGTAPADEEEEDEKRRRKRVSPYFYPNMRALRFLGRDIAYANPWKRMMRKRDLLETLANDDPSAFGYDKKRKRYDGGDGDEDVEDFDEKMRRKKKSA